MQSFVFFIVLANFNALYIDAPLDKHNFRDKHNFGKLSKKSRDYIIRYMVQVSTNASNFFRRYGIKWGISKYIKALLMDLSIVKPLFSVYCLTQDIAVMAGPWTKLIQSTTVNEI